MSDSKASLEISKSDLPLWLLGIFFLLMGAGLGYLGGKTGISDLVWSNAQATAGRVVLTSWQQVDGENRLQVTYSYSDDHGIIFHSTGELSRKLGKINLEPGSPVVVLYKPDNHEDSVLKIELGFGEWVPVFTLGLLEMVAGIFFLATSISRFKQRRYNKVS